MARQKATANQPPSVGMSCIRWELAPRAGHWTAVGHFDVPDEGYTEGNLRGMRLAAEFAQMIYSGSDRQRMPAFEIIADACRALDDGGRRGAAVGFLREIERWVIAAASHPGVRQHAREKVERFEQWLRDDAERERARRQDFARRMEIARAAKARARAAERGLDRSAE